MDILTDDGTEPNPTTEIPLKEEISTEITTDEEIPKEDEPTYKQCTVTALDDVIPFYTGRALLRLAESTGETKRGFIIPY